MARGQRSAFDSKTGQTTSFQLIKNAIQPTKSLSDVGLSYFNRIISSRERSTWNDLDIHAATRLALTLVQIDEMYECIEAEGWFQRNSHGVKVRHPATTQLDRLCAIDTKLTQTLGLTASMRQIAGTKQAGRNRSDQQIQDTVQRAEDSNGILA